MVALYGRELPCRRGPARVRGSDSVTRSPIVLQLAEAIEHGMARIVAIEPLIGVRSHVDFEAKARTEDGRHWRITLEPLE